MIDEKAWNVICSLLSIIDHSRRPNDEKSDAIGNVHVILFGHVLRLLRAEALPFVYVCVCPCVQHCQLTKVTSSSPR